MRRIFSPKLFSCSACVRFFTIQGLVNSITIVFLFLLMSTPSKAALIVSSGSGNWSSTSTWSGGVVPTCNDSVVIQSTHTISLSSNLNITCTGKVVIILYGVFNFPPGRQATFPSGSYISIMNGGHIYAQVSSGQASAITIGDTQAWQSSGGDVPGPACVPSTLTGCYALLPVEIKLFNSVQCEQDVCHTWVTATEKNCKNFCVEKSNDGIRYYTIGCMDSKAENGTSHSDLSYALTETNASKGLYYYRLRQTDHNGRVDYFDATVVNQRLQVPPGFEVKPNPSNGTFLLQMNQVYSYLQISVYDRTGRLVEQRDIENTDQLRLQLAEPGIYLCKVGNGLFQSIQRIIVE